MVAFHLWLSWGFSCLLDIGEAWHSQRPQVVGNCCWYANINMLIKNISYSSFYSLMIFQRWWYPLKASSIHSEKLNSKNLSPGERRGNDRWTFLPSLTLKVQKAFTRLTRPRSMCQLAHLAVFHPRSTATNKRPFNTLAPKAWSLTWS